MLGTAIKNTILFLLIILILHFLINNVLVEKKILVSKEVKNDKDGKEEPKKVVVDLLPDVLENQGVLKMTNNWPTCYILKN